MSHFLHTWIATPSTGHWEGRSSVELAAAGLALQTPVGPCVCVCVCVCVCACVCVCVYLYVVNE